MAWDKVWNDIFLNQEWGKYPSEDLIRFTARNFYNNHNRKEIKILEVGCGVGANLWYLSREGFSVYGIDGSEIAVKKATQRLDNEIIGWTGEVIQGDILNIPYEDNFFDAVIDSEAIYANDFENAKKIYNEIFRVLKPNGKLFTKHFANGCWGDQTGEKVGYNAWIVDDGPMLGKGLSRFATEEDMILLLDKFQILEFEIISRSCENQKHLIKEWIVIAQK